jgi:hypothetical protein
MQGASSAAIAVGAWGDAARPCEAVKHCCPVIDVSTENSSWIALSEHGFFDLPGSAVDQIHDKVSKH